MLCEVKAHRIKKTCLACKACLRGGRSTRLYTGVGETSAREMDVFGRTRFVPALICFLQDIQPIGGRPSLTRDIYLTRLISSPFLRRLHHTCSTAEPHTNGFTYRPSVAKWHRALRSSIGSSRRNLDMENCRHSNGSPIPEASCAVLRRPREQY
jgi:hypothetical protein